MDEYKRKEYTWWKGTADNFWSLFFRLRNNKTEPSSPAEQKKYDTCSTVFLSLNEREQDILLTFYSCPYKFRAYAVEDYSSRTGFPIGVIYAIINRAGRAIMVELGIIDKETK